MKVNRAVLGVLAVVILALAAMGGFYLGRNTVAGPVRIISRAPAQAGVQAEGSQASGGGDPSRGGPPEGAPDTLPVNINTATAEELQELPGIGKARAEAIVAYREEHGPFAYVEDLRGVSGIGEGILANIMDYITVGEQNNG